MAVKPEKRPFRKRFAAFEKEKREDNILSFF